MPAARAVPTTPAQPAWTMGHAGWNGPRRSQRSLQPPQRQVHYDTPAVAGQLPIWTAAAESRARSQVRAGGYRRLFKRLSAGYAGDRLFER